LKQEQVGKTQGNRANFMMVGYFYQKMATMFYHQPENRQQRKQL
jgi:hypothetical protein